MKVKFSKINENAKVPAKQRIGDAAYDLYAAVPTVLEPGEVQIVKTGLKIGYITPNWELSVVPRSGFSTKGIFVGNSPGTIDENYRGEIGVILYNSTKSQYVINLHDRIAQIKPLAVENIDWEESDEVHETERGENGFGSSGK